MPDSNTMNATLQLVHIPDEYTEGEKLLGASWPLGAGHIEVRAIADNGAFVRLARVKAGGFLDDVKRAKQAKQQQANRQPQTPPDQTQQPTTSPTTPPPDQPQV